MAPADGPTRRWARRVARGVAVPVAIIAVSAGCSGGGDAEPTTSGTASVTGQTRPEERAAFEVKVRQAFDEMSPEQVDLLCHTVEISPADVFGPDGEFTDAGITREGDLGGFYPDIFSMVIDEHCAAG